MVSVCVVLRTRGLCGVMCDVCCLAVRRRTGRAMTTRKEGNEGGLTMIKGRLLVSGGFGREGQ